MLSDYTSARQKDYRCVKLTARLKVLLIYASRLELRLPSWEQEIAARHSPRQIISRLMKHRFSTHVSTNYFSYSKQSKFISRNFLEFQIRIKNKIKCDSGIFMFLAEFQVLKHKSYFRMPGNNPFFPIVLATSGRTIRWLCLLNLHFNFSLKALQLHWNKILYGDYL